MEWGGGVDWIDLAQDRASGLLLLKECNEPSGSVKMRGISLLAEELLASQEGLCSMVLIIRSHLIICVGEGKS